MQSTPSSDREDSHPAPQEPDRRGGSADDGAAAERKGWGRGAATALDSLRRRGFRGRREPEDERPSGT